VNNIELLSPAGSIETLYAGINAGADAVYIGGQQFGARAYADNPDASQLLEAINYVHFNNKKIYLTVNTLLKDEEIEEQLFEYILPLYTSGLDAVIVQDLGVFQFIKDNFPNIDIHASTQMGISGIEGAKLLKNMGASRIVTARELSLSELKSIHNEVDIEIESFIHGAMCYSYSGMCLFSSIAGGRSGNRGRCAGPCRQPYQVYESGNQINDKNSLYALSLKDMNTLSILPDIIDSGVYSLKIEGRMKSSEYAAGVVSIYRKYIDMFFEKGREGFEISEEDIKNLSNLYSRSGSTTGYYKVHNSKTMVSFAKPTYKTENTEFLNNINENYCQERQQKEADAKVVLKNNELAQLEIYCDGFGVSVIGEKVETASNRPLSEENILKQLNKTGDSLLKFHKISIIMDDNVFMPVKQLNELRRKGINEFTNIYLKKYRRNEVSPKNNNFILIENEKTEAINEESNKINVICSVNTPEQAGCVLGCDEIKEIYVSTDYMNVDECESVINNITKADKKCYIIMPSIFREKGIKYMNNLMKKISFKAGLVVRNIDELGYVIRYNIQDYIVDNSLYSFNKYSYEFFKKHNAKRVTLSYELNYKELIRHSHKDNELVVYGKIPLMVSSECINMNYNKCDRVQKNINIKDRLGYDFIVRNCCNYCYNIIYNNVPLSLLGVKEKLSKINTKNYRINFTTESEKDVKTILDKFIKTFYYEENIDNGYIEDFDFTRGHFKRGVE
jgi:putative protease